MGSFDREINAIRFGLSFAEIGDVFANALKRSIV
jgi:hypothetical protein